MRTACGFQSSDPADPMLQRQCPSVACARSLLPLLEDCAEHIAEFARHIGPEAAFYEALGHSDMFNSCLEMDQSAVEMASVQVEFRAPTLEVAEQMIAEHQRMVDAQFLPTSEADGGQQLCFGNADASAGDGTRCGGRRQLGGEDLRAEVCADKDEEIRRLKAELEKSRAASAKKDQIIEQHAQVIERQTMAIEKQANEIAFHKRLHRHRHAGTTHNNSGSARRNQTAVGRRTQASSSSDSSVLRSARVGADRSVKACAVHPCQLSDGICQNGGTCVEVSAEVGGAVPLECQCAAGYGGDRCETDVCASTPCLNGGSCASADSGYECDCGCGYHGDNCEEVSELGCAACSTDFILRGSTTSVGGRTPSYFELSELKLFNEAGVNIAPEAIAVLLDTRIGVGAASDINDRYYWNDRFTSVGDHSSFVSWNDFHGRDLAKITFLNEQEIVSAELYTTNYDSFGTDAQIIAGSVSIPVRSVYLANDPSQRCFAGGQVSASPCSTEEGSAPYQDTSCNGPSACFGSSWLNSSKDQCGAYAEIIDVTLDECKAACTDAVTFTSVLPRHTGPCLAVMWNGPMCHLYETQNSCLSHDRPSPGHTILVKECGYQTRCVHGRCLAELCSVPARVLDDSWRTLLHGNDGHWDNPLGDNPSDFGDDRGVFEIRIDGSPAGLPLATTTPSGHSMRQHCGTFYTSWVSGWPGPHVTGCSYRSGVCADHDGGPPWDYTEPFDVATLPRMGAPALDITVCFDGGGDTCGSHAAVRVANCGDRFVWELPPAPAAVTNNPRDAIGYCAAPLPADAFSAAGSIDSCHPRSCSKSCGMPCWESGDQANPDGHGFTLFLLPQAHFTGIHDAQHYADLCEAEGLRPVVTGDCPDDFNCPGFCSQWNCMKGLDEWNNDDQIFSDQWWSSQSSSRSETIWSSTGWSTQPLVMFSGGDCTHTCNYEFLNGGIMNSQGWIGHCDYDENRGWEDAYHPLCGLLDVEHPTGRRQTMSSNSTNSMPIKSDDSGSTRSSTVEPNLDLKQLAQVDIDPVLMQFIGNVVAQLIDVKTELQSRNQVLETENKAVRAELQQVKMDKAAFENKTQIVEAELRQANRVLNVKVHDLHSTLLELASRMKGDVQNISSRLDQCEADTHPFIQEIQASQRRRLQDEETLCRGSGLSAMFAACCPSSADNGGGHRRFLQSEGCDMLPNTCSAACAPLFIEYFEGCQGIIDDLAPDQRQMFVGFYGDCQEVEQAAAAMLEDARPAMIFHVVVMSEAAAQQAQMFGGGSAPAPPIGPLPQPHGGNPACWMMSMTEDRCCDTAHGPSGDETCWDPPEFTFDSCCPVRAPITPPPPTAIGQSPSPNPAGGAEIAQEFRRVCTTANLTVCVPQCNELTSGFLLSIEIDGKGTVMTCNKMGARFSWQGQASLGGFIGDDFGAFFSSVVSGAAGTYMVTVTEGQDVRTELTVRPGQAVVVGGDRSLQPPPAWGVGGFAVEQFGSLALSYVRLDAQVRLRFLAAPPLCGFFWSSLGRLSRAPLLLGVLTKIVFLSRSVPDGFVCVSCARPPISPADLGARGDRWRRALAGAARPAASGLWHGARRPLRRRQPPRAADGHGAGAPGMGRADRHDHGGRGGRAAGVRPAEHARFRAALRGALRPVHGGARWPVRRAVAGRLPAQRGLRHRGGRRRRHPRRLPRVRHLQRHRGTNGREPALRQRLPGRGMAEPRPDHRLALRPGPPRDRRRERAAAQPLRRGRGLAALLRLIRAGRSGARAQGGGRKAWCSKERRALGGAELTHRTRRFCFVANTTRYTVLRTIWRRGLAQPPSKLIHVDQVPGYPQKEEERIFESAASGRARKGKERSKWASRAPGRGGTRRWGRGGDRFASRDPVGRGAGPTRARCGVP
eukprot:SAG11_NODE_156_length_14147_cov_10.367597_3_plen_1881_part_00